MQYKVPQNIDIEDKVIAGLTLRQFMFILIGGGFVLLEYYAFGKGSSFLFLPIAIITAGIAIAFAFAKINDRPFEVFVSSAIKSLFAPHQRVWRKDVDLDIPPHTEVTPQKPVSKKRSPEEIKSGLERLAMVVDSGGAAGIDSTNERKSNIENNQLVEPQNIQDVLAKTEQASPSVDAIMAQAKEYVKETKKEQPISVSASKNAVASSFEYDKLELANEKKLEETLKLVNEHQKNLEDQLANAKIEKFDH